MIDVAEESLYSLLERNKIDLSSFITESYKCMLISIFEVIVNEMNDLDYRRETKQRFLNSVNKLLTTERIVYEKTKCKLSENECRIVYNYIHAYFGKLNVRISYDDSVRHQLLSKQKNKCNICKKNIMFEDSELDHIVPWTYVGDELGLSNLQMLCKDCNHRKSKNSAYNLKMFLVNK